MTTEQIDAQIGCPECGSDIWEDSSEDPDKKFCECGEVWSWDAQRAALENSNAD